MSQLRFRIQNGYGIGEFDETLLFDGNSTHPCQSTNLIYAQNGIMKSSFARTVRDYSGGEKIKDHIFDLDGNCTITDESGNAFPAASVISIPSFNSEEFRSRNMSALLVNGKLRKEYDALTEQYNNAYIAFMNRLKSVSGIGPRTTLEQLLDTVCSALGNASVNTPAKLVQLVKSARTQIEAQPEFIVQLPYTIVGSSDAQKFAEANQGVISELMKARREVEATASFLRAGFDTGNAQKLAKEIERSNFFRVNHGLELFNHTTQKMEKVTDIGDLRTKLATDVDAVLAKYPGIKTKFTKMMSDLSTDTRRDLKQILDDPDAKGVIFLMDNASLYKRHLWQGYLKGCLPEFDQLDAVGASIEKRLKEIVDEAKNEATRWDQVVTQFNIRFRNLPYEIEVGNKPQVLLNDNAPELIIAYKHPIRGEKYFRTEDERMVVISKLSTGERKAFYLLNVMFEIEVAQQSGFDHLVILDDIVDSFDYKNKYAFLEYLYDVSSGYDHIKLVIMTHNFDFFRLLQLRLFGESYRERAWFAQKHNSRVSLSPGGQFNVIKYTREQAATDPVMWLALIPFARNMVEYKSHDLTHDPDYQTLTECLHGIDIAHTVQDVQNILTRELGVLATPLQSSADIEDELLNAAEAIGNSPDGAIAIQRNLVLAMATRRLGERYMKSRMPQTAIDNAKNAGKDFTRQLFIEFTASARPTTAELTALDQVNLITPEHIHVNSFMYEPLIDLGIDELKQLYQEMKVLNSTIPPKKPETNKRTVPVSA